MAVKYFSYRLDHDYGFAPNPFYGYCTLANCMPKIRSNPNLEIGDWIIGLGSKKLGNEQHLIYLMKVQEKLSFQEYWIDPRFQIKKPKDNGSLTNIHGDNIYSWNEAQAKWNQMDSIHSNPDGSPHPGHIDKDTGGRYVLVADHFYYFGDAHFQIPEPYLKVCGNNPRGFFRQGIPLEVGAAFVDWIESHYQPGIHGDPINWAEYRQRTLMF